MLEAYVQISGSVAVGLDEEISELCSLYGCLGSEIRPLPGRRERVFLYLERSRAEVLPALREAFAQLGAEEIFIEERKAEDWLQNYRRNLEAFGVGQTWWIDPDPGGGRSAPTGRRRLVMEPRMAFGSGSHETTQLMLEAIETENLTKTRVLDVGSGSGILSLAALYCGAETVIGVDIDLQSVLVARQLVSDQDGDFQPHYVAGEIEALNDGQFDVVLCNMLSKYFLPLLRPITLRLKRGASLLLSGLLDDEKATVLERLNSRDLVLKDTARRGEWLRLRLEKA